MEPEQSLEVNVRLVHHMKSEWFRYEYIKFITVMLFSVCDMNVGRYTATQVKQCVHLYSPFAVFAQSPSREFYAC